MSAGVYSVPKADRKKKIGYIRNGAKIAVKTNDQRIDPLLDQVFDVVGLLGHIVCCDKQKFQAWVLCFPVCHPFLGPVNGPGHVSVGCSRH